MLLSAAWSVGFNSDVEPLSKLWIRVSSAATPATILARLACAAARVAVLRNKYYCAIQACDAKLIMTGYQIKKARVIAAFLLGCQAQSTLTRHQLAKCVAMMPEAPLAVPGFPSMMGGLRSSHLIHFSASFQFPRSSRTPGSSSGIGSFVPETSAVSMQLSK